MKPFQSECPEDAGCTRRLRISANDVCRPTLLNMGRLGACHHPDGGNDLVPMRWQTRGPWDPGACHMLEARLGDRMKPIQKVARQKRPSHPDGGSDGAWSRISMRTPTAMKAEAWIRVQRGTRPLRRRNRCRSIGPHHGTRTWLRDGGGVRERERPSLFIWAGPASSHHRWPCRGWRLFLGLSLTHPLLLSRSFLEA